MHNYVPTLLEETTQSVVRELELAKEAGVPLEWSEQPYSDYLPLRVTTEIQPGEECGKLKSEIVVGRGLWLFTLRHLLTQTARVLHQHRWTIRTLPKDLSWFTSDDPVIRLNAYGKERYDFEGRWDNPGTELLLPLSPRHLLYAQVRHKPPCRGSMMSRAEAELVRRFCAEHADRMIIAAFPDPNVPNLRPRIVDADLFRQESEQWRNWHDEQTTAELGLRVEVKHEQRSQNSPTPSHNQIGSVFRRGCWLGERFLNEREILAQVPGQLAIVEAGRIRLRSG
jgi:uncharacterized protein DUF4238